MNPSPVATTVAVILVNWNGWRDTLECLDSLLQIRAPGRLHLSITDNASTDDSVARIRAWLEIRGQVHLMEPADLPQTIVGRVGRVYVVDAANMLTVSLLCNKTNDGFSAGNNLGMTLASALFGPDYFWILNSDTVVQQNALEHMLARMTEDSGIGICGASLLYYHQPEVVQAYGGVRYSLWTGRGWHIGAGQRYKPDTDPRPIEAAMTYVSGASMLVSRSFYRAIGPMDECFFLYAEELDWAWRARGRFRLAWAPKAVVFHKEGASIGTVSAESPASLLSEFYQTRSKLKFAIRHHPWYLPTVGAFTVARAVRKLLRGERLNALVIFSALLGRQQPAPGWKAWVLSRGLKAKMSTASSRAWAPP